MSDRYLAKYTISAIQYTGEEETLKYIGDFINGTVIPYLENNSILAISYDGEKCFELNIGDYLARIAGVYIVVPADIFEECFTKVK